jgi:hypothetical protein
MTGDDRPMRAVRIPRLVVMDIREGLRRVVSRAHFMLLWRLFRSNRWENIVANAILSVRRALADRFHC